MTTHICPKCHHIMVVPSRHVCNQDSESVFTTDDSGPDLLSTLAAVEVAETILSDSAPEITVPDSSTSDFSFGGGESGGGGADSSW